MDIELQGKMVHFPDKWGVTPSEFEENWEPTGIMIKTSPTTFVQTYKDKTGEYKGIYTQKRIGRDSDKARIILTQVENLPE